MFNVNGWELVIIVVVALLVIGPERLPEHAARLRHWVRDAKRFADGARDQLREQLGPEFDDIDWSAYDPRQYDPRRIVREALSGLDDEPAERPRNLGADASGRLTAPVAVAFDPQAPVPFDDEAT